MADVSASRDFHDPNPDNDTPVGADWFNAVDQVVFDLLLIRLLVS